MTVETYWIGKGHWIVFCKARSYKWRLWWERIPVGAWIIKQPSQSFSYQELWACLVKLRRNDLLGPASKKFCGCLHMLIRLGNKLGNIFACVNGWVESLVPVCRSKINYSLYVIWKSCKVDKLKKNVHEEHGYCEIASPVPSIVDIVIQCMLRT